MQQFRNFLLLNWSISWYTTLAVLHVNNLRSFFVIMITDCKTCKFGTCLPTRNESTVLSPWNLRSRKITKHITYLRSMVEFVQFLLLIRKHQNSRMEIHRCWDSLEIIPESYNPIKRWSAPMLARWFVFFSEYSRKTLRLRSRILFFDVSARKLS